jgi:hypothetical protein
VDGAGFEIERDAAERVHARFVLAEVALEVAAAQCGFGSHGPQITMKMVTSVNRLPLDGWGGIRHFAAR